MNLAKFKHAYALGGLALVALTWVALDRPEYMKGVSYHGINSILLNDGSVIRAESRLIIGDTLNFSLLDNAGAGNSSASLVAEILNSTKRHLTVKVENASNKTTASPAELSDTPDFFFGREYGLAKGATIHIEFLPVSDDKVICYYTKELDHIMCLNR